MSRDAQGGHYDLTAAFSLAAWAYRYEAQRGNIRKESTQRELRKAAFDKLLERIEGSHDNDWNTRWGKHI